jgi:glycosyltransferase involved in cell wall biosynthesis
MMANSRVSVVIPTYNRRHLLARAVHSVRAQTYTNWEIVVVDDGSNDDTVSYVQSLAQEDPRVTLISNDALRRGPGGARNAGIQVSTGEFVAFLDSDDVWLPEKLQAQVRYFEGEPSAMALGTDCYLDQPNPQNRLSVRYPRIDNSPAAILEMIVKRRQFWIYTPTVMVRRRVFTTVGLFNQSLVRCEDLVMWLAINQTYGWHYLAVPLAVINTSEDRNKDYSEDRRVPEGYFHMLFVRDLHHHVDLDEHGRRLVREQQWDPDYLYWRGRDSLSRWNPLGFAFVAAAVALSAVGTTRGRAQTDRVP